MKKYTFLLALILLFSRCDKCEDIACFTPPQFFRFQFVDNDNGEDLIANGTFRFEDIKVTDAENGTIINFSKVVDENESFVEFNDIGWETEVVTYHIKVDDFFDFDFYVDAEAVSEDCCAFTRMNEVQVMGIEHEINQTGNIFRILL